MLLAPATPARRRRRPRGADSARSRPASDQECADGEEQRPRRRRATGATTALALACARRGLQPGARSIELRLEAFPHFGAVVSRTARARRARRPQRAVAGISSSAARHARSATCVSTTPRACLVGIVERVGDELFFGDVGHDLVLTNGFSARRILATARKMLCRVAAGFWPSASLISSIGRCSRCRSVNAARSSGVRSASAASMRVAQLRPCAWRSGPGAGLARRSTSGSAVPIVVDHVLRAAAGCRSMAQLAAMRCSQVPKPGSRLEPRQLGVRLQKRVLHDVLGVLLVAGDPEGHPEDSAAVPLDERAERVAVAGPGLGQDEVFGAVHGLRKVRRAGRAVLGAPRLRLGGGRGLRPRVGRFGRGGAPSGAVGRRASLAGGNCSRAELQFGQSSARSAVPRRAEGEAPSRERSERAPRGRRPRPRGPDRGQDLVGVLPTLTLSHRFATLPSASIR